VHKHRIITIIMGMLLTSLAVIVLGACGSSSSSSSSSASSSPSASKVEQILGHAPTGLAKQIVDNGYFTAANDANYAPQSVVKKDGSLVGFDVDTAKKVGELLGLEVKFQNPAWDSIPTGLQTGRFDVSIGSMTITADRQKTLDFTAPYYFTPAVVITRAGTPGLDTVESLAGKTIGTAAGSSYYDWLQKGTKAKIKSYDSSVTSMTDLSRKRLDGVMTAAPTAQQAIAAGQPFQITGKPFFYEDLGMALKKGEPDWLALLDYAVKTMHEDGSLTTMSTQWYNGLDLTVQQ
jgi:polar amino acid transport system substrate-binding protein